MDKTERDKRWSDGNGYNRYISNELDSFRKSAWKRQIGSHFPPMKQLEILDAGTGPGFFACILSEEGHPVISIAEKRVWRFKRKAIVKYILKRREKE